MKLLSFSQTSFFFLLCFFTFVSVITQENNYHALLSKVCFSWSLPSHCSHFLLFSYQRCLRCLNFSLLFSLGLSYRCLVIGSIILHYRNMCIHYKLRYTYKGKHRKTWFLFFWVWDTLLDIFLSRCIHFPANFIFLYDLIKFNYGYVHFHYPSIY